MDERVWPRPPCLPPLSLPPSMNTARLPINPVDVFARNGNCRRAVTQGRVEIIEGVAGRASNGNDRAAPKVSDDVGYNPADRADHPAGRRAADLALQFRLGLLPERQRRASGDRAHYPAFGGMTPRAALRP